MPLQKNQIIQLEITGVTAEGSGVGRFSLDGGERGLAVFVPFTAIGDIINCHIVKVNATHAYGRVESFLEKSTHRGEGESPDCSGAAEAVPGDILGMNRSWVISGSGLPMP